MPQRLNKLPQKFIASEIDGEFILIHGDSGEFFSIGDVGANIWRMLDRQADLEQICVELTQEFAIEAGACRMQVQRFAGELVAAGFAEFA